MGWRGLGRRACRWPVRVVVAGAGHVGVACRARLMSRRGRGPGCVGLMCDPGGRRAASCNPSATWHMAHMSRARAWAPRACPCDARRSGRASRRKTVRVRPSGRRRSLLAAHRSVRCARHAPRPRHVPSVSLVVCSAGSTASAASRLARRTRLSLLADGRFLEHTDN